MTKDLEADGWKHEMPEGLIGHLGGIWIRRSGDGPEFGFLATSIHANRNGVVHGGMLMTFVDRAFGQTARETSGAPKAATISLAHQFMEPLVLGTFAIVRPKMVRQTTRLAFLEGIVFEGEKAILSAQGVWRLARSNG